MRYTPDPEQDERGEPNVPLEFLAALARLIPPPRVHRHRYHGILAPHARLRDRVTALGRVDAEDPDSSTVASHDPDTDEPRATDSPERAAARSRWARLLARICEVFPLRCPDCGGHMRILAFLTDPEPDLEFDQSRGG